MSKVSEAMVANGASWWSVEIHPSYPGCDRVQIDDHTS